MNKPRGRPFPPGNKQGRGRPKGSRNRAKSPGQALLDEYAPHLTRKCMAMALAGDRSSMRLCMERAIPARRGACIRMNLPAIRTAGDVDRAAEKVIQALRRGDITATEGGILMNTLESRSRIIERVLPEEPIGANKKEYRDPELAALTDDELTQLTAIIKKMEAARSGEDRADKPPAAQD